MTGPVGSAVSWVWDIPSHSACPDTLFVQGLRSSSGGLHICRDAKRADLAGQNRLSERPASIREDSPDGNPR